MNLILYAILIVSVIGALVGWSNTKKGAMWGQPVTIVCALIAIVIGFSLAIKNTFGDNSDETVAAEKGFQYVMTKKLGLYLKENFPGKKILILKDSFSKAEDGSDETVTVQGLRDGIGSDLEIVDIVAPEPPRTKGIPEGMEMLEPMEVWYKIEDFKKDLKGKKFDILVTFVGIPRGVKNNGKDFTAPTELKGKKIVIAGGSVFEYENAIRKGCVPVAVTYKQDISYQDKDIPKKLDEAFDKRFYLISSQNIDEQYEQVKSLFAQTGARR